MNREYIKEYQGNLLDEFDKRDSQIDVIAHGANCFNMMGAGIAKQIKQRYPDAYQADTDYIFPVGSMDRLGNISSTMSEDIFNIYSQYRPGADADYSALRMGLRKLNARFRKKDKIYTLGLPLIGCGIGGLEWNKVKEIIFEEIQDMNIHIVHFTNEYLEIKPKTNSEFNDKWRFHIEPGFEDQGLMINDLEVVEFLDKMFTHLESSKKHWDYSQIKIKFGLCRIYMNGVHSNFIQFLERRINELIIK